MPRFTDKRSYLDPAVLQQLKLLFGTAKNVHARLNLAPAVDLPTLQHALSGYPVPTRAERIIFGRWAQWRVEFLKDPATQEQARDQQFRLAGDYYDQTAFDPIAETLSFPGAERFTLLDDASQHA